MKRIQIIHSWDDEFYALSLELSDITNIEQLCNSFLSVIPSLTSSFDEEGKVSLMFLSLKRWWRIFNMPYFFTSPTSRSFITFYLRFTVSLRLASGICVVFIHSSISFHLHLLQNTSLILTCGTRTLLCAA